MTPPTFPTDPTDLRTHFATIVDAVAENTRAIDRMAAIIHVSTAVLAAIAIVALLYYIKAH